MNRNRITVALGLLLVVGAAAFAQNGDVWDRLIAENPEVARAFAEGADPASLVLADGTTLAEAISQAAPGVNALVYKPVAPCRIVRTVSSTGGILAANVSRHFLARTESTDFSAQGGSASGCGIPAAAEAIMVLARAINPSATGLLQVRTYGTGPPLRLVEFNTSLTPSRFANATILGLCVPQASCAFDFTLLPDATVHAEVYVVGHFSPPAVPPSPGFDEIASGTNTSAAMVVGSGSSLATSGSGSIAATTATSASSAATATALAADGTNCPAGEWAAGVDASGNAQGCTPDAAGSLHALGGGNTGVGTNALTNNTSGLGNVAVGYLALNKNSSGNGNTAAGYEALGANKVASSSTAFGSRALANSDAEGNTAIGFQALRKTTTGQGNTATGVNALKENVLGYLNTATGAHSLQFNTGGAGNTAVGYRTLHMNVTGSRNIAIGLRAGESVTGSDNIHIGNKGTAADSMTIKIGTSTAHKKTFITGIRGVTTTVSDAVPVLIDSAGQLGTVSSSRDVKEEIRDMAGASEALLALRPDRKSVV